MAARGGGKAGGKPGSSPKGKDAPEGPPPVDPVKLMKAMDDEEKTRWPPADVLSEEQLIEFREVFRGFDTARTGSIAAVELGAVLRALDVNPSEDEVKEYLAVKARDGRVDFEAFAEIMAKVMTRRTGAEAMVEAFRVFDKERTGFVTVGDFRLILCELGDKPLPTEKGDAIIEMADPDDTGVIAYPAFVRKLLSDAQIALKMPPPESEEDKKKGAKKK